MPRPLLGAHVSVAGGLHRAFERGESLGCAAIQIFVKNPNQWRQRALDPAAVESFRRARRESSVRHVVAHAAYLINLAARDRSTLERSRRALTDELIRCNRLGVDALVVHPGAHMERGEDRGLDRIADSLRRSLGWFAERESRAGREPRTRLLLENTAGQGTVLGFRVSQLARVVAALDPAMSLGLCLDTCHAFAAGYPLDRPRELGRLVRSIRTQLGAAEPSCIHVNDSRTPFASRRDRHANVGAGSIGEDFFGRLVRSRALRGVPLVLETPLGADGKGHARDLDRLRRLASRRG